MSPSLEHLHPHRQVSLVTRALRIPGSGALKTEAWGQGHSYPPRSGLKHLAPPASPWTSGHRTAENLGQRSRGTRTRWPQAGTGRWGAFAHSSDPLLLGALEREIHSTIQGQSRPLPAGACSLRLLLAPGPGVQHPRRPRSTASMHEALATLSARCLPPGCPILGLGGWGRGIQGLPAGSGVPPPSPPGLPQPHPDPCVQTRWKPLASRPIPRRHHTMAAFLTASGRSQVHKLEKVTLPTFIRHSNHAAIFTQTSDHLISLLRNHQSPNPTPHSLRDPAGPPRWGWGPTHTCPPGNSQLSPGAHQTLPPP